MDENSPYAPPKSVDELPSLELHDTSRSHWFIRTMSIFLGAMIVGMAATMALINPRFVFSLLWIGMFIFGLIFIRAGILDRPPKLDFLRAAKRAQRRKELW